MNYKLSLLIFSLFFMAGLGVLMPLLFSNDQPKIIGGDHQKMNLPVYGTVPQFLLTDSTNHNFGSAHLQGKVSVVNFFFSSCPDFCPKMNAQLALVCQSLKANPTVQCISVSVDPDRDTPEVLRKYAEKFGADIDVWHFLTGKKEDILLLAEKGFQLAADRSLIHSDKFVLVDQKAQIRGYYGSLEKPERDRLQQDVSRLARSKK